MKPDADRYSNKTHQFRAALSNQANRFQKTDSHPSDISQANQASKECRAIFRRHESRVQSYARSFPGIFNAAIGAEVWDVQGRRYLDFLAGAGSLNYGHNNHGMKSALLEYIEQNAITHSLDLHTAAKARFIRAMAEIVLAPRGLDYVIQFTGPTGTNAVEAALKIARRIKRRSNVLSFTNGFHGMSLGALAASGSHYHRSAAGIPLSGTTPVPYDGYVEGVDTTVFLDNLLSDPSSGIDKPAAVIVESIQGEGGLRAASVQWLQRLESICQHHDIFLILDDIQAGCGRTGSFFSFESAGIKPDFITLSKSLSGYGLPLAIVLLKRPLDAWNPGEHNGTFRGNNHAFVTATAALEQYWQTPAFAQEVCSKGRHLEKRLHDMLRRFSPNIIAVRGRGMMQGLLMANAERAAAVTTRAFKNGLIIERSGPRDEVIKCLMPLTIKRAELDEGLDILECALADEFCIYGSD